MKNLDTTTHNIKEARKAAYELFSFIEGNNIRQRRIQFFKNLLKSFFYSILLLFLIISIAKIISN